MQPSFLMLFVLDLLSGLVFCDRVFAFLRTKISTISVFCVFLSMQKLGSYRHIMDIGSGSFNGMHKAAVPVYADVRLIAKMPCIAFFRLMCVGIATLVYLFITEVLMRILAALTPG